MVDPILSALSEFTLEECGRLVRNRTGKEVPLSCDQTTGYPNKVWIAGRLVSRTRLTFALAHGWLPKEVDHKNGDRMDLRIENLRPSTRASQCHNRERQRRLLPRGVYLRHGRYVAQLKVAGRAVRLGTFQSPEAASEAVEAFARPLHGEFYLTDGKRSA